jgi:hypothetical protein
MPLEEKKPNSYVFKNLQSGVTIDSDRWIWVYIKWHRHWFSEYLLEKSTTTKMDPSPTHTHNHSTQTHSQEQPFHTAEDPSTSPYRDLKAISRSGVHLIRRGPFPFWHNPVGTTSVPGGWLAFGETALSLSFTWTKHPLNFTVLPVLPGPPEPSRYKEVG